MTRLIAFAGRLFRGDFGDADTTAAEHDDNSMRIDLELSHRETAREGTRTRTVLGGACRW